MKYFTDTISVTLAEKLKEKGMPITYSNHPHQIAPDVKGIVMGNFKEIDCPTYADTIDWFMSEKNIAIILYRMTQNFRIALRKADNGVLLESIWDTDANDKDAVWHEAANAAIEKALTLI